MKKIIIPILMLLCLMGIATAATVVTLDPTGILANASYQTSSTSTYSVRVTGNQSTYSCYLYTNENGSSGADNFNVKITNYPVTNNTNTSFVARSNVADIKGTQYCWDVFCNATGDVNGDWGSAGGNQTNCSSTSGAFNYSVDITDPVVTILYPTADRVWYNSNNSVRMGLNITDTNAASCILRTNMVQSTNSSGTWNQTFQTVTYTNATPFNFSSFNGSLIGWKDNGTGAYLYNYMCNDSAGNQVNLSTNRSFYVDIVDPTPFIFRIADWKTDNAIRIPNGSFCTDYTPQISWNHTTDLNFSRYVIIFFNDTYGTYNSSTDIQKNITTRTTNFTNMTALTGDRSYSIMIQAVDLAGNIINMSVVDYNYTTDSTSRTLASGWNIIMNTGNAATLSLLLNNTGATTASYWNATHEWESHIDGGSFRTRSIPYGDSVLLYMAVAGTNNDFIVNTSAGSLNYNLTNVSASNWNIACNRNSTRNFDFQELDIFFNTNRTYRTPQANDWENVSFFSYFNASASTGSKYVPFLANWSINNETDLEYGSCSWFYLSRSVVKKNLTITWGNLTQWS